MAEKKTNKLIPIIGVGVLVLLLAMVIKSTDKEEAADIKDRQAANVPDGDTTADTLRTLVAKLETIEEENAALRLKQEELNRQLQEKPKQNPDSMNTLDKLMQRVDALSQQQQAPSTDDLNLGFEIPEPEPMTDVWVEPIDKPMMGDEDNMLNTGFESPSMPGSAEDILGQSPDALENSVGQALNQNRGRNEEVIEPIYTIPKNSTFIGSTAMTALIGRVPINGTVEDPYPVKIIVGQDNLTSNGHEIPEVSQMIFSGTATGDWTLSCVRADLDSVTYIFEDGTIQTLSVSDAELNKSGSSGSTNRLAWISDNRGIPCVTGKRISNAASFLASSIFAKGVEAGAEAVADAETTRIVNSQGDTTESVTGDAVRNAGYETLSGGASAITKWLEKRQQQTFDVIYRDTGSNVSIHLDAEIPINYKPNGRKLRHARNSLQTVSRVLD